MTNEIKTSSVEIANNIIKQIKSLDFWFLASIGYNSPAVVENGVVFKVRGSKVGYAYVKITLNAMDTYTVEVFKVRRVKWEIKHTELAKVEGLYWESLVDVLKSSVEGR